MTEDDTFNRLRRIPYNEMYNTLMAVIMSGGYECDGDWTDPFAQEEIDCLESHGWSELEFKIILYKKEHWCVNYTGDINRELARLRKLNERG